MALLSQHGRNDIDTEGTSFTTRLRRASEMQRVGDLLASAAPECSFLIGGGRRRTSPARSPPVGLITRNVRSMSPGASECEGVLIGAASQKSRELDEEEFMPPSMHTSIMHSSAARSRVQMPLTTSSGRSLLKSRDPSKDITPRPTSGRRRSMQPELDEVRNFPPAFDALHSVSIITFETVSDQ
jgi:hypothetical protein